MFQPIYDFLISHGVTNLIDVDGLIYAPADDLLVAFIRFGFLASLFGFALVAAACWLCQAFNCNHPSADG